MQHPLPLKEKEKLGNKRNLSKLTFLMSFFGQMAPGHPWQKVAYACRDVICARARLPSAPQIRSLR